MTVRSGKQTLQARRRPRAEGRRRRSVQQADRPQLGRQREADRRRLRQGMLARCPTIIDGASALGLDLDEVAGCETHCASRPARRVGQRMNLTAIRERPQQITKHVLDSLTCIRGCAARASPTSAVAPASPAYRSPSSRRSCNFTLIESTGKKCRFLEHVRDALGLGNVEVVQSRAEDYKPAERFDTVLARAVGPLADLVRYRRQAGGVQRRPLARHEGPDAGRRTGQAAEWLEIGRSAQVDGAWPRRGTTPGRTRALAHALELNQPT